MKTRVFLLGVILTSLSGTVRSQEYPRDPWTIQEFIHELSQGLGSMEVRLDTGNGGSSDLILRIDNRALSLSLDGPQPIPILLDRQFSIRRERGHYLISTDATQPAPVRIVFSRHRFFRTWSATLHAGSNDRNAIAPVITATAGRPAPKTTDTAGRCPLPDGVQRSPFMARVMLRETGGNRSYHRSTDQGAASLTLFLSPRRLHLSMLTDDLQGEDHRTRRFAVTRGHTNDSFFIYLEDLCDGEGLAERLIFVKHPENGRWQWTGGLNR